MREIGPLRIFEAGDPIPAYVSHRPGATPGAAERPLPGLATQAVNFAAATARDVAAGFARLDADAVAARLAVCLEGVGLPPSAVAGGHCDRCRPSDGRCSACGCYLEGVDAKAARPHERCPLGRWPGEEPAEGTPGSGQFAVGSGQ